MQYSRIVSKIIICSPLNKDSVCICNFCSQYLQAVSVAAPLHGYQAPPPGYPVYSAPPPHILPPVHAMPPGYPPNQQYYGQPPPGAASG